MTSVHALAPWSTKIFAAVALGRRMLSSAALIQRPSAFERMSAANSVPVPIEALIRTGRAERVIVALGDGRFAARTVTAGRESGEDIEILGGLRPGEQVVISGQFMIDSESQVRSSLRRYEQPQATTDQSAHPAGPVAAQAR